MALTTESHTLRVRTGEFIAIAPLGTDDLPDVADRAQAKALHKNIHHQYSPSSASASAKPGLHTRTDLNRDSKS
jgi:hypothetical protein